MPLPTNAHKSRIILGLMTFGPDPSAGARITALTDYNTILNVFQSRGYNEVDTARAYVGGKQEAFTREANWRQRGLTLATKLYPNAKEPHSLEVLTRNFETSLKELGTDSVDIFYLHAADRSLPFAETLEAVDTLHKQGKFVQLGLSNFTAFEVAEVVMTCKYNGWVRPTLYQGMYNAITRSIEAELVPACRRYGLDIVIYNPTCGGLFSGKYKTSDIPSSGRFSDSVGRIGELYRNRYFKDSIFEALRIIEPAVEKAGLTMIETALRWCVHHSALHINGGNDGIIIGVSSLTQLQENLDALERGPLPAEIVKALDEAWVVAKAETPNYWHLELKYTYDTHKTLFGP